MKTAFVRTLIALFAALAIPLGMAAEAQAYVARSCTLYLTARLSATAWQTSSTNTRMHLDLNPYSGTGTDYMSRKIEVDGIALKDAYGSYVVNDVYINRGASTSHSVRGWWRGSNGYDYSCAVTIPSYPGY